MKRLFLVLLLVFSLSFSYYYLYLVNASDHSIINLVYDDYAATPSPPGPLNGSYSYADNSLENPDVELRICADTAAELQNKWISMVYADGVNPGDYLEITHYPLQITTVPPINCVYVPIDLSSFKAWYPSIPFVFISDSPDLSIAERHKMVISRGWLVGNYTVVSTQAGNIVSVNVTDALDDNGNSIVPDVDFLVVGLVQEGTLETTDTAITSINDPVNLSLGAYTGSYDIHINGIGPGTILPEVTIITPEPTTYATHTIPFTYTITSYYDLASCWYVLDGITVNMPDCSTPYILNVGDGLHSLSLYAEDIVGQIGSDSVNFRVESQPTPPTPGGGGGAAHVPQPIPPEEIPPLIPPAYELFSINPEDIDILVNYPLEGEADFTLYSVTPLEDVTCFINADFGEYTRVELESSSIEANSTIKGTIIVDMPSTEILDYDGEYQGIIQCVGKNQYGPTLMLSTAANLYLEINKPWIVMEDKLLGLLPGEQQFFTVNLTNVGNGTAYAYSLTLALEGPEAGMFVIVTTPSILYPGESKEAVLFVSIPYEAEPGTYLIPVRIYENGRLLGGGALGGDGEVDLLIGLEVPPAVCRFPIIFNTFSFRDLVLPWTFLAIFFIINLALLQWNRKSEAAKRIEKALTDRERRSREIILQAKLLLFSLAPILLSLPNFSIFNPCFMMNVALFQFIGILLWKLKQERDRRKGTNSLSK